MRMCLLGVILLVFCFVNTARAVEQNAADGTDLAVLIADSSARFENSTPDDVEIIDYH